MKAFLKKNRDFKKILVIVFSVALFIFLLNFYQKEVRNFFYLISSPIQKTLWRAGDRVSGFFETIAEIKNLKKENENLKSKLKEILAENVALLELKEENEILRQALEIGLEKEFKLILAQITGKDVSQDSILIDKGDIDGILEGFPVITQQKILVGKISEVYKDFSKVMLISNKESSFDGKIVEIEEDKSSSPTELPQEAKVKKKTEPSLPPIAVARDSEVLGIIKGKGNLRILFDLIPKEKEIEKGDLAVTSALGGVFPQGLIIGEIQEVTKSDLEPFQVAQIQPAFDIGELEKLFIIIEW